MRAEVHTYWKEVQLLGGVDVTPGGSKATAGLKGLPLQSQRAVASDSGAAHPNSTVRPTSPPQHRSRPTLNVPQSKVLPRGTTHRVSPSACVLSKHRPWSHHAPQATAGSTASPGVQPESRLPHDRLWGGASALAPTSLRPQAVIKDALD